MACAGKKFIFTICIILGIIIAGCNKDKGDDYLKKYYSCGGRDGRLEYKVIGTFGVTVDYSRSLEQMIDGSDIAWAYEGINHRSFPMKKSSGKEDVDLTLVYLAGGTNPDNMLSQMDGDGYRPATLAELLAFAAKFPKEVRKHCCEIKAFGSYARGTARNMIPSLDHINGVRLCGSEYSGKQWYESCVRDYALFVRK